ncbi:MAG: class I SAM-dependent methyltransferase [Myxococcales bacterium]|nr:class I SAM-dependent methyltransferase [Myxococcales bacterium]
MRIHSLFLACALSACASATPDVAPPAETAAPTATASQAVPETSASAVASSPPPKPSPTGKLVDDVVVSPAIKAIVDAKDRDKEDRALDDGRHPDKLLAFFDVKPGQRVAELMAGGGYSAELFARAVGPKGKVFGQNSKWVLERFAEKPWAARLAKPVNKGIVRVDRELEAPLPPEAKDLDAVFLILFYHDTVWLKTDRAKMNKAIFDALKPGGVYAVIDHTGREGTGTTECETLHRIEEKVVREEITQAGFVLAEEASFLRNKSDTKDWNASPRSAAEKRGTSDRLVFKFVKP